MYESFPAAERPRLRPPVGIPVPAQARARSVLASVALHALVIALLVVPFAMPAVVRVITGTDSPTASGGGGGGLRGSGGDRGGPPIVERLRFVQIAAPPPPPPTAPKPPVTPPVPPIVQPPVAPKVTPATPAQPAAPTPPVSSITAPVAGSGGGTGADGTLGSGPGTGGGVGSGVGAGRGSGVGPTVGGNGVTAAPAPTLIETFLPPNGVSKRDKGKTIIAVFDVDSTGRVLNVDFTQVSDGGYNRKLREVFEAFRFRPAVRSDGTPIRAKTSFEYVL